jgi:hypothetical protein
MNAATAPQYLSAAKLKERGWTDSLVRGFLHEPDCSRRNPYYRSAAPMRLYVLDRVQAVEASEAYKQAKNKTLGRQAAAAQAVATKRRNLMAYLDRLAVVVPTLPLDQVMKEAVGAFNVRLAQRDYDMSDPATMQSDRSFLERITVNFLRHELSAYEDELAAIYGQVGVREGYVILSGKVFQAIAGAYSDLAAECDRQMALRSKTPENHSIETVPTCLQ